MISVLLAIPRHLSWATYARVSSNARLLPAILFLTPKASTIQRWYVTVFFISSARSASHRTAKTNHSTPLQVQRLSRSSSRHALEIDRLLFLFPVRSISW
jgi:hypothetical protein